MNTQTKQPTYYPIGIYDFALMTPLGHTPESILHHAMNADTSRLVLTHDYLQGKPTFLGKIDTDIPQLPPSFSHFNCRANQLLAQTIQPMRQSIERIKSHYKQSRIATILGTSSSGVDALEQAISTYDTEKEWPQGYKNHYHRMGSVSAFLAEYLQISGPNFTVSTACSSSSKAFITAQRWLQADLCDIVICGGVDILSHITVRGFDSLGALSSKKMLPFSENRQGINIGEAAAIFILGKNDTEFQFIGCAENSDAHHISAPHPQAEGAIGVIEKALQNARINFDQIDYVNLHGTGTLQNDPIEAHALHSVFKDYTHHLPVSSSKGLIGHTLGASGAVELGLSLYSMSEYNTFNSYLPHAYDDQYDNNIKPLSLVKAHNHFGKPKCVMSNAFAFGGSNASLIVKKQ